MVENANADLKSATRQLPPEVISVKCGSQGIQLRLAVKDFKGDAQRTAEEVSTLGHLFFGVDVSFTGIPVDLDGGGLILELDQEWLSASLAQVTPTATMVQREEVCSRQSLEQEECHARTQLRLPKPSQAFISVDVRTLQGTTHKINNLVEDDTFEVIKERMRALTDIPIENQVLIYDTKRVHDAKLKDLAVKDGAKMNWIMTNSQISLLSFRRHFRISGFDQLAVVAAVIIGGIWGNEGVVSPRPGPTPMLDVSTAVRFLPFESAHWYLRCCSPNPLFVWSPENDKNWPFLFRKVIRLLSRIRVPQGSGESVTLPLPLVAIVAKFL